MVTRVFRHISLVFTASALLFVQCQSPEREDSIDVQEKKTATKTHFNGPSLVILGTAQDGGRPHLGCTKACCTSGESPKQVISLGIYDGKQHAYLFEATPDMVSQWNMLKEKSRNSDTNGLSGVFLTHAHIGHYTGLMYCGKEAMNTQQLPVYTMPRMADFLEDNGPWSQLVSDKNITLMKMQADSAVQLPNNISVTPFLVPHRDEFSETAGFRIEGPNASALFIPDIDKWGKWERSIIDEVRKVDYAFLDATFYSTDEIPNRDISEIPHPLVTETMDLLDSLPPAEKQKVIFIHFNHTNPLHNNDSQEAELVREKGYRIGQRRMTFKL